MVFFIVRVYPVRGIPRCPTHPTVFRIIPYFVAIMQPSIYNANYLPPFLQMGWLWFVRLTSSAVVDLIHHGDRITSFDLFLGISASCVQRFAASSWCMCASAVPAVFAESYVHSSNSFLHTALLWKSGEWQLLLFWYCIIILLLLSSLHFLYSDAT